MLFTVGGMALGGWLAGALYDLTGNYTASILAALGFNVLNVGIAAWLIARGPDAAGRCTGTAPGVSRGRRSRAPGTPRLEHLHVKWVASRRLPLLRGGGRPWIPRRAAAWSP